MEEEDEEEKEEKEADDGDDEEEEEKGAEEEGRAEEEKKMREKLITLRLMRRAEALKDSWSKMQQEDEGTVSMKGTKKDKGLITKRGKIVVPDQARRVLLHLAHGELASHDGINATTRKLRQFYWRNKKRDITNWVRHCRCAPGRLLKRPDGTNKVFDSYRALQAVLAVVDYLVDTKIHARKSGSERYILCMVDRATGYTRLAATKTRTAASTALAIKQKWVNQFGCPDFIFSDNEGALQSKLTEWLCRAKWRAKLIFFAPYQKTGGGMVERKIQEAETRVRAAKSAGDIEDSNRDEWLAELEWEVNAHEGTKGSSSFENLYGLRPKTPISAAIPISVEMTEHQRRKWQSSLRARNQDNQVRRALAQPRRRGQGFKDKPTEWGEGTLVWTKKEGTGVSSLEQQWVKATIKKILSNRRSAIVTLVTGGDLHRRLEVCWRLCPHP